MQCNYLTDAFRLSTSPTGSTTTKPSNDPLPKICKAGPGNYTPTTEENEEYCNTIDFQKCPRFEASIIINKSIRQVNQK
jgi:hypothetical protein